MAQILLQIVIRLVRPSKWLHPLKQVLSNIIYVEFFFKDL